MKRIVLMLLILSPLLGCMEVKLIPAREEFTGIDFRPYAEKDFLITPYAYAGKFTTIAMINYTNMPEARLISIPLADGSTSKKWIIGEVETQIALDSIYAKCIEMGANALMDFKIISNPESYSNIANPVTIEGLQITGIAIRRED